MLIMEEMLTPEDIAKILNVSEYTVREKLRDGDIKGKKVRNQWRVKPSDLQDYINSPNPQPEDKK